MKNSLSVAKMKLFDCLRAMGIFYSITILFVFLMWYLSVKYNNVSYNSDGVTLVFLFICGLNSFKESFKFSSANGVSRKRYFRESLLALVGTAALAALIELVLPLISQAFTRHEMLYVTLYRNTNLLAAAVWTFALFFGASLLGWLISLIYYRCNSLMKIVVSLSPVYVTALMIWLNRQTGGKIFVAIGDLISFFWGIADSNSYVAVLNFLVISILFSGLIFLLLRRAPVKE